MWVTIRKRLFILQSKPKLKELFPRGSVIPSFRWSKNLKELLAPSRFKAAEEGQTVHYNNGCFKCDRNVDEVGISLLNLSLNFQLITLALVALLSWNA